MTKSELNLRLAKALYPDATEITPVPINYFGDDGEASEVTQSGFTFIFDYRDWNDLMPHVIKHNICLCPEYFSDTGYTGKWDAEYDNNAIGIYASNKDPQRALAECLLEVLERKDD